MFQSALAAQGLPPAEVVAWCDLLSPGAPARVLGALSAEPAIVRIDSACSMTTERSGSHLSRLLTVQELADLLQIPAKTIYTWRYKRIGPPAV